MDIRSRAHDRVSQPFTHGHRAESDPRDDVWSRAVLRIRVPHVPPSVRSVFRILGWLAFLFLMFGLWMALLAPFFW